MAQQATATQIDLRLHAKQSQAFSSPATEILYGGAAGGGKSHLMRVAAIAWCTAIPGLQVYLFRRTYPELLDNHINGSGSFLQLLAPWIASKLVKVNLSKLEIEFTFNGSKIHLCHCQNENDVLKYQGAEIHVLLIDELTHFTGYQFRFLRGRCRIGGLTVPDQYKGQFPRILCGSNPGGVGHNWVKMAFVDNAPESHVSQMEGVEGGMTRQFIRAKLEDNPTLTENDPNYRQRLQGLGDAALVKAMESGDWNIVAGGMFDDVWLQDKHVVEPFDIPASWHVDRSFDWGSSKPFSVGWWAESDGTEATMRDESKRSWPKGTLFLINEWYGWNGKPNEGCKMLATEIADEIKNREIDMRLSVNPGPADSSIFASENGNCIAQDMAERGVHWLHADKSPGSRKAGWEKMRARFKAAHTWPMEEPGLFFFDNCTQAIRTIPVLPRDPKKTDDVQTESEDHCFEGGTFVDTEFGPVPIADLVGKTGHVYGSDGKLHYFQDCWRTRKDAEIVSVVFDDGRNVLCTPGHKFMTESGDFLPVKSLLNSRVYGIIPVWLQLSAQQSKNTEASGITNAVLTSREKAKDCMSWFGKQYMDQPQRGITFTTPTTTGQIMSYQISGSCLEVSICDTTCASGPTLAESWRQESDLSLSLGTSQTMGESGTSGITKRLRIGFKQALQKLASIVGRNIPESARVNFALMLVSLHGGARLAWTLLQGIASFARQGFKSANTGTAKPALGPAAQLYNIVSVEPAGKADVYCLSVPDLQNFTIEGGLIVHNCGDMVRYRVHTPNVGNAY